MQGPECEGSPWVGVGKGRPPADVGLRVHGLEWGRESTGRSGEGSLWARVGKGVHRPEWGRECTGRVGLGQPRACQALPQSPWLPLPGAAGAECSLRRTREPSGRPENTCSWKPQKHPGDGDICKLSRPGHFDLEDNGGVFYQRWKSWEPPCESSGFHPFSFSG